MPSDWPRVGYRAVGVPRDIMACATILLTAGVPTDVRSAEASSELWMDTPWAVTAMLVFVHPFRLVAPKGDTPPLR